MPMVEGERVMCCAGSGGSTFVSGSVVFRDDAPCCTACRLETDRSGLTITTGSPRPVQLEPSDRFIVLFRAAERRVERIRIFSLDCELDAGGRVVHWLTGVQPAESLALLAAFVGRDPDRRDRLTDAAISAIAMHDGSAADAALDRFAAPGQPEAIRRKAAFWMGNVRGRRGFETLRRLVREDASEEFRKNAVFALGQSREPEAIDTMIALARDDRSPRVRGEALFWLAQKAGQKAAATITEAIERDPESAVKKRAVFALSQLPKDEGVPLLIQIARTNKNPIVRKEAIFWLGQSRDTRALAFFEEVFRK
jgi:hypothetical protein